MYPFERTSLRRYIRLASLAVVALSLYSMAYYPEGRMSPLWAVFLGLVAITQTIYHTDKRRRFGAPVLFAVFYTLGYVLVMVNIIVWPEHTPREGFGSVGKFFFTDAEFALPAKVIVLGSLGINMGSAFAHFLFPPTVPGESAVVSSAHLHTWLLAWTAAASAVVAITWQLGIGRTGLDHAVVLPFKLTGALVLMKSYIVPATGTIVVASAVRNGDRNATRWMIATLTMIGVGASVSSLSRSYLPFCVTPAMILLLVDTRNTWSRMMAIRMALILIPLAGVTFQSVDAIRKVAWTQHGGISESQALSTIRSQSNEFGDMVGVTLGLATERVGGLRELLGILSAGEGEPGAPWGLFTGDIAVVRRLTHNSFGLDLANEGGQAFGIGVGLWGTLASGGSLALVFAGSAVLTLLMCAIEELFRRRGVREVGIAMAMFVGLRAWTQPVMVEIYYFSVIIAATYWLMTLIEPRKLESIVEGHVHAPPPRKQVRSGGV